MNNKKLRKYELRLLEELRDILIENYDEKSEPIYLNGEITDRK